MLIFNHQVLMDVGKRRGALGSGLAIFSRFPILETHTRPYALNGSPIDVVAGDWFVGKAAVSIVILHPLLKEVEVFNTHVSLVHFVDAAP